MNVRRTSIGVFSAWIAFVAFTCSRSVFSADVVVDSSKTFQTIEGWGNGGDLFSMLNYVVDPSVGDPLNRQTLDYLIDDLGLTGSRTWEVGPRIDGTGMDNGDCDVIDWTKFQTQPTDPIIANYMVYFSNRIAALGFQTSFYSSPGYPTHASDQKPWIMYHPGERAQQLWANALWWKNNYQININYAVICNEPQSGPYTSAVIADDIKALGPRFVARGLSTKVQYAECVTALDDWNYVKQVQNDPAMWPYVGRLSYHTYGTSDPYRTFLRDFGLSRGLVPAQTEMADPTFDDLYSDLTLAGVNYWETAYSGSNTLAPSAGNTSFTPAAKFFRLRQLMHYVRPGHVRIGADSSNSSIRALAFSKNGAVVTIIENTSSSAQTVNLSGLPPGTYGLSQSAGSPFQELGVRTVGANGTLTLTNVLGGSGATTLYPYSGPNHAPTITTWGSNPGYVVAPATTATLSVTANDAELDPLTYAWSVFSQPAGASAVLATPASATTEVSGLSVAGTYIFNINVKDAVNTSSKRVYLIVYASNPPPVLGQTGFRIATPYGLVFGDPSVTTHANIELPTSSVILQAGIGDLANDDFTGRGTWSLVSQPAGANASLGATQYIFVSIRAQVTNMTTPGDYTFQVNVTNPPQADLTAQVVCTVNAASSGPVISLISASPASLTLPASTSQLSATTSDPQGQLLRHWWVVKTAPAGFNPVFDHQGLPTTNVLGLTLPGNYTFTLRAFDDIHMTTSDVNITVSPAPSAPVVTSSPARTVIAGNPFTYTLTASNNPTSFNASGLPPGLTFNNGVISGTPTVTGTTNIGLSATNSTGTGNGNLALTVNLPAPVITSALNADGLVNVAFNYTIDATNVPSSYTATGLPAGLTLGAGAVLNKISGTPTAAGVSNVTITATNASGTDTRTLVVTLYASASTAPGITSPISATGTVGTAFNYTITANNTPTSFFAAGLPAGLNFNPVTGVISGTPSASGTSSVTLSATNFFGTGTATLSLTINPAPLPLVSAGPNDDVYQGQEAAQLFGSASPLSPATSIASKSWTCTGAPGTLPANVQANINTLNALIGGSNATLTLTFATGTLPIGDYTLQLTATDNLGLSASATTVVRVYTYSEQHLTALSVTRSPATPLLPSPTTSALTLSAAATTSYGPPFTNVIGTEYRFSTSNNSGALSVIQDWSNNSSTVIPAGLATGYYQFYVEARMGTVTGTTTLPDGQPPEITAYAPDLAVGISESVTSVTLSNIVAATIASPATTFTVTSAQTANVPVFYNVLSSLNGGAYTNVANWQWQPVVTSAGGTFRATITDNAPANGIYTYKVQASTLSGTPQATVISQGITVGSGVTGVSLGTINVSGSTVSFPIIATVTGTPTVYYHVARSFNDGAYAVLSGWNWQAGTGTSIAFSDSTATVSGFYTYQVEVSSIAGLPYTAYVFSPNINVGNAPTVTAVSVGSVTLGGNTVSFPINATVTGTPTVYYHVARNFNGGAYSVLSGWNWKASTGTSIAFSDATATASGIYNYQVECSPIASGPYTAYVFSPNIAIGPTVTAMNLGTMTVSGSTISFPINVTLSGAGTVYYHVARSINGSGYTVLSGWNWQPGTGVAIAFSDATANSNGIYNYQVEASTSANGPYTAYVYTPNVSIGPSVTAVTVGAATVTGSTVSFPINVTVNGAVTVYYHVAKSVNGGAYTVVNGWNWLSGNGTSASFSDTTATVSGTYWYQVEASSSPTGPYTAYAFKTVTVP